MTGPEPLHVALHEAAHAVVGVHLGYDLVSVTLEPTAMSLGATTFSDLVSGTDGNVLVSLAGPAMNFELGIDSTGCDKDGWDALGYLAYDEAAGNAFLAAKFPEALELVRELRSAIGEVASRLLLSETLDGPEVQRLLAENRSDAGSADSTK